MASSRNRKPRPGYKFIYPIYITRGGRRVFASEYGMKCWRIEVPI